MVACREASNLLLDMWGKPGRIETEQQRTRPSQRHYPS